MKKVFNFSGGKTSAYMTIKYYEAGDLVIFADTGREHEKTYKFIHDFEAFENIPVIKVALFPGKDSFAELLKAKNYNAIPNMNKRFCTNDLKIKVAKRYLRKIGVIEFENFIGFRSDEKERVLKRKQHFKKVHDKFPLYYDGSNKAMINEYWKSKPYNLEIPSILGNCTLCFMKGKNAIISILSAYPELAAPWIEDEQNAKHTYFEDVKIKTLLQIAQSNLFKNNLEEITPAFNCACGV